MERTKRVVTLAEVNAELRATVDNLLNCEGRDLQTYCRQNNFIFYNMEEYQTNQLTRPETYNVIMNTIENTLDQGKPLHSEAVGAGPILVSLHNFRQLSTILQPAFTLTGHIISISQDLGENDSGYKSFERTYGQDKN